MLQWRRPADEAVGWGVGFFQGGEILLKKRPHDEHEVIDPTLATEDLRTDLVIAHVRRPGVGGLRAENTQPFRYRNWLFAQTGNLPHFEEVRRPLEDSLPEFLRRNVRGETDGELMFYLFLAALQKRGHLIDVGVRSDAIRNALRDTFILVDRVADSSGLPAPSINVLLSNGEAMVATHRGSGMAMRLIEGASAVEEFVAAGDSCHPRIPNLEATRFTLIASDYDDPLPEGFQGIQASSIVTLDRESAPRIEPL